MISLDVEAQRGLEATGSILSREVCLHHPNIDGNETITFHVATAAPVDDPHSKLKYRYC